MMKRLLLLLLVGCLLLSGGQAEGRMPLRCMNIDPGTYFRCCGIEAQDVHHNPWALDMSVLLQGEHAPDLLQLDTARYALQPLDDAGLLADLSGYSGLGESVARMVPSAQALVTTEDGRIIGMPVRHYLRPFYWNQAAWDAAGLTEMAAPRSYEELLTFLEWWCTVLETEPDQPVCVSRLLHWNTGVEKHNYAWWLMEMLLACWEAQQWYAGKDVCFNDPEFIALADRTLLVAQRLYSLEPRQARRENVPELFTSGIRGGNVNVFCRPSSLSGAIPLRITCSQPALMWARMDVWCIRAGSEWQDEAAGFITSSHGSGDGTMHATLYSDFPAGCYGAIDISLPWLEDYRRSELIIIYPPSVFNRKRSGTTGKEKLMMCFFRGDISADVFAIRLDRLIR